MADATCIPAREEDAQHNWSVAYAVKTKRGKIPQCRERLREVLREVSVPTPVTDGQMNAFSVDDRIGRCRWHLPCSVRHLLYNNDAEGARNQNLISKMSDLVYTDYANPAAQTTLAR